MRCKALGLDMDGTALNEQKSITPRTQSAITRALEAGVVIFFCSGRSFAEIQDYSMLFPAMRWMVLASGALVWDTEAGAPVHRLPLEHAIIRRMLDLTPTTDAELQVLYNGKSYMSRRFCQNLERYQLAQYKDTFDRTATLVDDTRAWLYALDDGVEKVNYYHSSPQGMQQTLELFTREHVPIEMANAEATSLECSAQGVSKAVGIAAISRLTGIPVNDIGMVGDSGNDIAALQAVGLPIAVGNASAEVRALCRVTVADNNHDGVAEAIERFCLPA